MDNFEMILVGGYNIYGISIWMDKGKRSVYEIETD